MNLAAFLLLSVGMVMPSHDAEGQAELRRLQGEWTLLETADHKRSERGAADIRMVIANQTMTMLFGRLETNRGTMAIGQAQGARTIDMTFANGKTVLGVYELTEDVLTICIAERGNSRPTGLAPRGGQWLEKWKRVQP